MEDSKTCVICQCGFLPREDDGGKCKSCAKLYPGVDSLNELTAEKQGVDVYLTREQVEKVFDEKLEAMFLIKVCEKCGRRYVANSAAQRTCHKCKAGGDTKQETNE